MKMNLFSVRARLEASESASPDSEETFKFEASTKVIENMFGPNSTDCCFRFSESGQIKKIKSHRKLLTSLSPVFAAMFNGSWDSGSDVIPITDSSHDDFATFLDYFYKSAVKLNERNVCGVLYLAHKYDIEDLVSSCSAFLINTICTDNVVEYYEVALRFDLHKLRDASRQLLSIQEDAILKSMAFIRCNRAALRHVLVCVAPGCKAEDIFDACIEWAKNQCEVKNIDPTPKNLRIELGDCYGFIDFKSMDIAEFATRYKSFKAMFTRTESDDIFMGLALPE